VELRGRHDPALGAAHVRDADLALRRAGLDRAAGISATNPAVSLPEIARIHDILRKPELLVVVQDLYLTETAALADVVLPAAPGTRRRGR
jgi:anaerobic selenocysteine-containing dehydrogenase